jgi:hypothetical protein
MGRARDAMIARMVTGRSLGELRHSRALADQVCVGRRAQGCA